jgi:hypothetical protein
MKVNKIGSDCRNLFLATVGFAGENATGRARVEDSVCDIQVRAGSPLPLSPTSYTGSAQRGVEQRREKVRLVPTVWPQLEEGRRTGAVKTNVGHERIFTVKKLFFLLLSFLFGHSSPPLQPPTLAHKRKKPPLSAVSVISHILSRLEHMTHLYPLTNPPPPTLHSIHPIFFIETSKKITQPKRIFFSRYTLRNISPPPHPEKKKKENLLVN